MNKFLLPSLACLLLSMGAAHAAEFCHRCGCACCTEKICHVVCETKKMPKICYSCECEDFCVPGRSEHCGCHWECVTDPCDPCCTKEKKVHDWIPGCGEVYTRNKLVKTVVQEEKKTYRWVVEDLCPGCAALNQEMASAATEPALPTEVAQPTPVATVVPASATQELPAAATTAAQTAKQSTWSIWQPFK